MNRGYRRKRAMRKLFTAFICIIAAILPLLFVTSSPYDIEAATISDIVTSMQSATSLANLKTVIVNNESNIASLSSQNVKSVKTKAHDLFNGGLISGRTDTSSDNYTDSMAVFDKYYQKSTEFLQGTHSSGTVTYNIGGTSQWKGVADSGFKITGGEVNLVISSTFFTFHGQIELTGGTLNITLADGFYSDSSMLKREIENGAYTDLRGTDGAIRGTVSGNTYTPATDGKFTKQFHDSFFLVKGGTLNIDGVDRLIGISGAGQFTFDSASSTDTAGLVFPALNAEGNPVGDAVEASAPLIHIVGSSDQNKAPSVNLNYVKCVFNYNNGTNGRGGVIRLAATAGASAGEYANITVNNSEFYKNYARTSGSFMDFGLEGGGGITINNSKIHDNYAASEDVNTGGTLRSYGTNMVTLAITNTEIYRNWTKQQSHIVWSSINIDALVISDCKIFENTSYSGPGAIYCLGGRLSIGGTTNIKDNTSVTASAGAIMFSTYASSTATSLQLTENANLVLDSGVTISGNKAALNGGAIFVSVGTVGTGIATDSPQWFQTKSDGTPFTMNLIINGATITNNSAANGGAIAVVKRNQKDKETGQDNSLYNASVTINSGLISGNTASKDGGAFYLNDENGTGTTVDFFMKDGTVQSNSANSTSGLGGGVYVTGGGSFFISGGAINRNTAYSGGGSYVLDGNFTMSETAEISSNNAYKYGGGAYVNNGNFTMENGSLSSNTAVDDGGGVYVSGGNFRMLAGEISGNRAVGDAGNSIEGNAGAAFISDGGDFVMDSGLIDGNTAAGSGGAFHISNGGTFRIKDGTIQNNASTSSGGVARMDNAHFIMDGGTITLNWAQETGGVICMLGSEATCVINGGIISGNYVNEYHGGALYTAEGANITVTGGTFTGNSAAGNGGAVCVSDGNFTMTGGSLANNTALGDGGAIYVASSIMELSRSSVSVTIGKQDCPGGDDVAHPVISNNTALNGGGISVYRGSVTLYCGSVLQNNANINGGAIYVRDGDFVAHSAKIENNTAAEKGGGVCVIAENRDVLVTVLSGLIRYNAATEGGGMYTYVSDLPVATIEIGSEPCNNGTLIGHKHPRITNNVASKRGGGICFISANDMDIFFTMWCGDFGDNTANDNVPSGNIIQEGGSIKIYGDYAIDNVTITNGEYLRPTLGDGKIELIYMYQPDSPDGKVTTVTVAKSEHNDKMFINLPASDPDELGRMLVRWEIRNLSGEAIDSRQCGEKFYINESTVGAAEEVIFYAVWMYPGDGFAETPIITAGERFELVDTGDIYIISEINSPFTIQYTVSSCHPTLFGERTLYFNDFFKAGTVIIMIDMNETGANRYYYYTLMGDEDFVSLSEFGKMGAPGETWKSCVTNDDYIGNESFLFIFDFSGAEEDYIGTIQITLARAYEPVPGMEETAPILQTVSCSVEDGNFPAISLPAPEDGVETNGNVYIGESINVDYLAGIAGNVGSIYNEKETSLVISAVSGSLPSDSYITIGDSTYRVNSKGVIILPGGKANEDKLHTFNFYSKTLSEAEREITLKVDLYITDDELRPMSAINVSTLNVTLLPTVKPAITLSLPTDENGVEKRVYYIDDLPAELAVIYSTENADGYILTFTLEKLVDGAYAETTEAGINDSGVITFADGITSGTFRIRLTLSDSEGNAVLSAPYNFVILD